MIYLNIHWTTLSKCNQKDFFPPTYFIPLISSIDTDLHILNIKGIAYCPGDTLQMYLRLMIYHGKESTKTISKADTLTSNFKKFPSNLFDLWKCVQVHREWFQIYHILVRIINDFQFVNLMPPTFGAALRNHQGLISESKLCSWSMITLSKYCYLWLAFHLFSTPAAPSFLSPHVRVPQTFFKRATSKHQSSHSLCHCLVNLLELDIALLVPTSWHVHF